MDHFGDDFEAEDISGLVEKFEEMLKNGQSSVFFDSDQLSDIIDYYYQWLNIPMAKKALSYAEDQFPMDPEIKIRKVRLLHFENKTREALDVLNELEVLNPNLPEIFLERGHIYSQMALMEQAVENYKKALPLWDQKDEIYFYIGSVFSQMAKWDDAAFYFQKVLKSSPDFEEAISPYTEAMIQTSRPEKMDECIKTLNSIIDERPYSLTAWLSLAQVYVTKEDYMKALDALEYADAIEPNHPEIILSKADCYLNLELPEKAIELLQELQEKNDEQFPAESYHLLLGEAYENTGNFQKSLLHYNKVLQLDETNDDAWLGIGVVLNELGRYVEAKHYFMKAVELNPYNSDHWFLLANCLKNCGLIEEAIQSYVRSLELAPEEPDAWIEFIILLISNNYYAEAEEHLMQAIKHFPDMAVFYYLFAGYLFSVKKQNQAMNYLEKGLELNPHQYEYLFMVNPSLMNLESILNKIKKH
jgi:tetratricopeptide (TPR) repeat protein